MEALIEYICCPHFNINSCRHINKNKNKNKNKNGNANAPKKTFDMYREED